MAQYPSSRSRPRRAPRVQYAEDDSDSVQLSDIETRPQPSRAARRRVQTYRESSDEPTDESSSEDSDSLSDEVQPQGGTRSRPKRPNAAFADFRKRKTPSSTSSANTTPFSSYKRRKTRPSDPPRRKEPQVSIFPPASSPNSSNRRVPPWQQLPYHVLVNIMQYATYPLYGKASRTSPSIDWLCKTSTLCRSFHEACMAALLYCPPLYPAWRAHGLIRLLKQEPGKLMTDHRRKIRYLDIEVKQLLVKKSGIAIDDLISHTPLLQGLRLYSNHDDLQTLIWAQPTARKVNWSYPAELFDRLDSDHLTMRSFEWNGRFPSATEALQTCLEAHSRPSFRRLREVSLLNLTLLEKPTEVDIAKAQSLFAAALKELPDLESLSMRNCGILDDVTASMLPTGLQYLELSHCSQLTSTALEQYLRKGGSSLRTLRLFGNQSMSLGFMPDLKTLCPRLQNIDIDMLYIDPTSYRDREPLYDELLPNGPPSWPVGLVSISFENMRQLSAADAEEFFDSLVDSSGDLQHLKKLNIKAILKGASWRDRAQLRKTWLPKLENVFLNVAEPSTSARPKPQDSSQSSQRQSSRIANSQRQSLKEDSDESDAAGGTAIHGRCDIVNLVISDQRPSQDQYHEEDFLDDEPGDDEEWDGRNDPTMADGYAW